MKWTKEFKSAYNREYYRTHKESMLERQRIYRKEKINRGRRYTPRKETAAGCNAIMEKCKA